MAGRETATDRLLVAVQNGSALVKVSGRGTFKISSSLREFGIAAIGMDCRRIVFDMSACVGMDSTFMGTIAGLALRLREKDSSAGAVILCRLSEKTMGLVKTLGLDRISEPYLRGEEPDEISQLLGDKDDFETLIQRDESAEDTTEVMLNAHESLVDVEPDNIKKFRDVIDFLREDLNRNTES